MIFEYAIVSIEVRKMDKHHIEKILNEMIEDVETIRRATYFREK